MNDLMVQIMLHGLIALAPPADGQQNHMTALLVDATETRSLQCFELHKPQLIVITSENECKAAKCKSSGQECTCDLKSEEVILTPDVQPAKPLKVEHPIGLPFSRKKALDFGYIANLAADPINQKLDAKFLAAIPPTGPGGLVARMTFPFLDLSACALAVRHDEAGDNVHEMSFRPLGQPEQEKEHSQAVAQMLMAHYMLPEGEPVLPTLKVTLKKFDGSEERSMNLIPGINGYFIRLENSRSILPVDDPCDDGIGRDFAMLYDLAENPPPQAHRKVPHVKYTRWKSSAEFDNDECQGMKDLMSRPVCPIGSFFPVTEVQ